MKYTIIKKGISKREMMEKTFCFFCGCFQGGNPDAKPTTVKK